MRIGGDVECIGTSYLKVGANGSRGFGWLYLYLNLRSNLGCWRSFRRTLSMAASTLLGGP